MLLINVPFPGFHESRLDDVIGYELEREIEDYQAGEITDIDECDRPYFENPFGHIPVNPIQDYIGKVYLEQLSELLGEVPLKFDAIDSPREYNFTTDRLFAYIHPDDAYTIYKTVMRHQNEWGAYVEQNCSHRSGFVSNYPSDFRRWPKDISQWNHNHLYHLLSFYTKHVLEVDLIDECTTAVEEASCTTSFVTEMCYEYFKTGFVESRDDEFQPDEDTKLPYRHIMTYAKYFTESSKLLIRINPSYPSSITLTTIDDSEYSVLSPLQRRFHMGSYGNAWTNSMMMTYRQVQRRYPIVVSEWPAECHNYEEAMLRIAKDCKEAGFDIYADGDIIFVCDVEG